MTQVNNATAMGGENI